MLDGVVGGNMALLYPYYVRTSEYVMETIPVGILLLTYDLN